MRKRSAGLDVCGSRVRLALMAGNCALALLGLGVFGAGVFISADKLYFVSSVFGIPIIVSASYFIIAAGILAFLISFFGCLGAMYQNRMLLLLYCIILSIVFMLATTGAALAIVFRSWVRDQVRTYMTQTLKEVYGINLNNTYNERITRNWDEAQQRWYCCGVDDQSWGVYRASEWYGIQPGVPESTKPWVPPSCCKKDQYGRYLDVNKCQLFNQGPPAVQSSVQNECLFYRGCYQAGTDALYAISAYLICIGLVLAFLIISGIFLSLFLFRLL